MGVHSTKLTRLSFARLSLWAHQIFSILYETVTLRQRSWHLSTAYSVEFATLIVNKLSNKLSSLVENYIRHVISHGIVQFQSGDKRKKKHHNFHSKESSLSLSLIKQLLDSRASWHRISLNCIISHNDLNEIRDFTGWVFIAFRWMNGFDRKQTLRTFKTSNGFNQTDSALCLIRNVCIRIITQMASIEC